MLRSQMIRAVLQTVLLSAVASVVSHHLLSNAYENISQHELWQNFTAGMDWTATNASDKLALNETTMSAGNATLLNATSAANETKPFNLTAADWGLDSSTFYKKTLPLEVFFLVLFSPIYYIWHLWLGRSFPARPKPTAPHQQDLKGGETSVQEEEVIQKWIAQGKIHRASLSWWNTFVKWIINLILAPVWMDAIQYLLEEAYHLRLPKWEKDPFYNSWKWQFLDLVASRIVVPFFGIRPLSTLVAFAIIPAHQRMVFEAGLRLIWKSFSAAFLQVVAPWLANTEFAAEFVRNMNGGAELAAEQHARGRASLPDEL